MTRVWENQQARGIIRLFDPEILSLSDEQINTLIDEIIEEVRQDYL